MQELLNYLAVNKMTAVQLSESKIKIDEKTFELVLPDEDGKIFVDGFALSLDFYTDCDNYVFFFGGDWCYTPKGTEEEPILNKLEYFGKSNEAPTTNFISVHGSYEVLNGSRSYYDWLKKAKFLGVERLGVCEKNTLAGIIKFQMACEKYSIKPIIGATYVVYRPQDDYKYEVKLYVKDQVGWDNILKINYHVNVLNERFIKESDFFDLLEGLILVLDPKYLDFDKLFPIDLIIEDLYFAFDVVKYEDSEHNLWYQNNLLKFHKSGIAPLPVSDAYYLEAAHYQVRKKMNIIASAHDWFAKNQYFKSKEDYVLELSGMFDTTEAKLKAFISKMYKNLDNLASQCDFTVPLGQKHLPKYKMTPEEKKQHKTSDNLFWHLIEKGLTEKGIEDFRGEELDRIDSEVEIIDYGKLKDYFLINWEEVDWCKKNGILTGFGRGSAPSFLVTYLLDITKVHPFQYSLIAERFLTKERAKHKIADIDIDVMQGRRGDVIDHLVDKYGESQCCHVGTYGNLKIKSIIKDLSKLEGLDFQEANKICTKINDKVVTVSDFFKLATVKPDVKKFVKKNPIIFKYLPLLLGAKRSKGIHASAFIITPDDKKVWEWMPVRKDYKDGKMIYVSEWEGVELEEVGFLKQDVLGLTELDKFKMTADLVKAQTGEDVEIYNIPTDDKTVFQYMGKGWNADIFQFGTTGLSSYCKKLKPNSIHDLVAAVALYRPGTMENGFHTKYVLRKSGEEEVTYFSGTKNILSKTYGLMVYQEDIMFICKQLGGFDLAETDEVRRAIGKKKIEIIEKLKARFLEGSSKNGYDPQEMSDLWEMMVKFSSYSFNLSHSVVYALTGYKSQYDKVHYPIEFWTTSLSFADDKAVPEYLSEIYRSGDIQVLPPNINKSTFEMFTDYKTKSIYWGLNSVKNVGEVAVNQIIKDRNEFGEYFSLKEFIERNMVKDSGVNKRVVEHLIMSGSFDLIERIESPKDRLKLIQEFRAFKKVKIDKEKDYLTLSQDSLRFNWWWNLRQKMYSGIAFFDFKSLVRNYLVAENYPYVDGEEFQQYDSSDRKLKCTVGGYVSDIEIKESKKGAYAKIRLDCNYVFIDVVIWSAQYDNFKEIIASSEKSIMLISGLAGYDRYNEKNVLSATENTEIVVIN